MYVCNCNGLTLKQVQKALAERPSDEIEVYRRYGCEPQCGRCVPEVRAMLESTREPEAA